MEETVKKRGRKKRHICQTLPAKLISLFLSATEKDAAKHDNLSNSVLVLWSNGLICMHTFRRGVFYLVYDKYRQEGLKKWESVKKSSEDLGYDEHWGFQLIQHRSRNLKLL
jgi:hypothetical protein